MTDKIRILGSILYVTIPPIWSGAFRLTVLPPWICRRALSGFSAALDQNGEEIYVTDSIRNGLFSFLVPDLLQ